MSYKTVGLVTIFLFTGCAVAGTPAGNVALTPELEMLRSAAVSAGSAFTVTAPDGAGIFVRSCPVPGEPRASAVVVHGIAYHGEPYGVVVGKHLAPRGIAVYTMDLRGHGLSDGARGFLAPADTIAADIAAVVESVRARHRKQLAAPDQPAASGYSDEPDHPAGSSHSDESDHPTESSHPADSDHPVFLVGESLGGVLAVAAAAQSSIRIDGLALLAPAFTAHPEQWFGPNLIACAALTPIMSRHPFIKLTGHHLTTASRDPDWIAARSADTLAQRAITPRYLMQFLSDAARCRKEFMPKIRVPILVQLGDLDRVVLRSDLERVLAAAGSTSKKLIVYPEAWHTLVWDPVTPVALEDLANWMLAVR